MPHQPHTAVTAAVARRAESSIKQVAKDFGISESCLRNWLRPWTPLRTAVAAVVVPESEELRELRRRNHLIGAYAINAAFDVHDNDPGLGYRFIADELVDAGHLGIVSAHARKRGKYRRPGPAVHDDLAPVRRPGASCVGSLRAACSGRWGGSHPAVGKPSMRDPLRVIRITLREARILVFVLLRKVPAEATQPGTDEAEEPSPAS